jgi:hypothetical protein
MLDVKRLFDPYDRRARLYPALLTLLPLIVLSLTWWPGLVPIGQTVLAIAVTSGLLYLLSDYARTLGKRLEPDLKRAWGGWPTTIWLRNSDSHLSLPTKRRYHDFFLKRLGAAAIPTPNEEIARPHYADEKYDACVAWLKEQCRGDDFPLVAKENATYGFRRNLLGLKPIGVAICLVALVAPMAKVLVGSHRGLSGFQVPGAFIRPYSSLSAATLGALSFALLMLLGLWLLTVRRNWVREAGNQYARTLLAACDTLAAKE